MKRKPRRRTLVLSVGADALLDDLSRELRIPREGATQYALACLAVCLRDLPLMQLVMVALTQRYAELSGSPKERPS